MCVPAPGRPARASARLSGRYQRISLYYTQVLHEENDELHRTVDSFEIEVKELRARAVVPRAELDALEAKCSELQETVWELEELRRSQAWQSSVGSPAGQGSVRVERGGVGDVSMSEAMMAQEVIADLRRQLADFESHVRARDQAVAAAVAAFDSAPTRSSLAHSPQAKSLYFCIWPELASTATWPLRIA